MKYAIIATGGKQYKVKEGDVIEVEHLKAEPNQDFTFTEVLLYVEDGTPKIGTPTVSGISVVGKVIGDKKGEKIRVAKFLAKSRYRRTTGHRQLFSQVKIESIDSGKKLASKKEEKKAPEKKVVAVTRTRTAKTPSKKAPVVQK